MVLFNELVAQKGAELFITYPACQRKSVDINQLQISKIEEALNKTDLKVLGTPSRYSFPDSLMFEQAYHLNKTGVDKRTNYLIKDIINY